MKKYIIFVLLITTIGLNACKPNKNNYINKAKESLILYYNYRKANNWEKLKEHLNNKIVLINEKGIKQTLTKEAFINKLQHSRSLGYKTTKADLKLVYAFPNKITFSFSKKAEKRANGKVFKLTAIVNFTLIRNQNNKWTISKIFIKKRDFVPAP